MTGIALFLIATIAAALMVTGWLAERMPVLVTGLAILMIVAVIATGGAA